MKLWPRSKVAALTAALMVSTFLWEGDLAKEICQDAGAVDPVGVQAPTPVPTTTLPTSLNPSPVPGPSEVPAPISQLPTPSPMHMSPTPSQTTTPSAPGPVPSQIPSPTLLDTLSSTETPMAATPVPSPVPSPTQTHAPTPAPTPDATSTPAPSSTPVPSSSPITTPMTTKAPTPAPNPITTPVPPTTTAPVPTTPAPAPTTLLPTPSPSLGCAPQLKNIYYHGFDITAIDLDTPEECCTACSNEPTCRLYTHFKSSTTGEKRCYLKTAAGEKTNYGDSKSITVMSAFVNLPAQTPSPWTPAMTSLSSIVAA